MKNTALAGVSAPRTDLFSGGGEMGELMRAYDWSTTPLGPPETWSQSLRVVVRIMLTSRYAMWLAWGPELTFFCNDAYRPTLGVKQPWALGSPAHLVWAEIWKDIGPRIETVMASGVATYDEGLLLFLERSGYPEETYHTFSYSPVPGDSGGVGGMLCVVTEETERVLGERRLEFLRDLAALLAATNTEEEAVAAVCHQLAHNREDLPFTLLYLLDPGGERARLACCIGFEDGEFAAPEAIEVETPDQRWPIGELLARAAPVLVEDLAARFDNLPTGAWDRPPSRAILVPIAHQGHERPAGCLIAGINPYRAFDPAYAGFVDLVAGQIASGLANAWAYEEARRRAEVLAELDRAKTTFFSNVSHEFRTPLTLMLGPIEDLLARPDLGPELRQPIDLAHRNGLRLLRLVNTLLDFSRIEAGRTQASFEPVDLAAFTADLASSFRSACERSGLGLAVDCQPLPEPVHVDRDMWEKIVLNLLSNAFKFTFEGGIAVRLRAGARAAELAIEDTGVGIPAAELPRLFERFHRIEGQRGRTHEGTGIGLALVQELVRLHGGQIEVRSTVDRGTTFTVTVPLGTAHLPADRIGAARSLASTAASVDAFVDEALRWLPARDAPSPAQLPPVAAGALSETRKRILLADDNADMRDYVRRLLAGSFDVESVADGRAALAAALAHPPDLVLSDVMMPELDGFELLQALRADPTTRELPVILLSARAGEEARLEGLEAGADDYLTKPFSARELVARVEAHLRLSQLRRETAQAVLAREEHLRLLLHELSHRVKNILAVIQSVATQTGARALTVDGFLTSFRGRLQALAAAHEILTASGWQSAGLGTLARATLAPYLDGRRISLALADAPVSPSVAQTAALALHELATNAVKHGALSVAEGKVTIDGRMADGNKLVVLWHEHGGPPISAPTTTGFGMTLLTRAIRHQHKGDVELDWHPEGLRCRITLPVAVGDGPILP